MLKYDSVVLAGEPAGVTSAIKDYFMFSAIILNEMIDMYIDSLQIGTHPFLTASPISYPVTNATVDTIKRLYQ